jgi:hypothetical protein
MQLKCDAADSLEVSYGVTINPTKGSAPVGCANSICSVRQSRLDSFFFERANLV